MTIHRKKRQLNRRIPHKRDTKLYIIATEGAKTEKQYFDLFHNPKIQVKILPSSDNRSAPKYVIERLDTYRKDHDLKNDDELWFMVDIDRWEISQLSQICKLCLQKGYKLAISNPCFEIWLILHFFIPILILNHAVN